MVSVSISHVDPYVLLQTMNTCELDWFEFVSGAQPE